ALIRRLLLPAARADAPRYRANVDIDAILRQMPDIVAATDYLFGRLAAVARAGGARLLVAMDGDRPSPSAGDPASPAPARFPTAAAFRSSTSSPPSRRPGAPAASASSSFPTITGTSMGMRSRRTPSRRPSKSRIRARRTDLTTPGRLPRPGIGSQ